MKLHQNYKLPLDNIRTSTLNSFNFLNMTYGYV